MSRTEFLAAAARAALHDGMPLAATRLPQALSLLPALHHQAGRDLEAWRLLAASPRFCLALILEGASALACGESTGMGAEFAWGTALLVGILAMVRNHINGFARHPCLRAPAESAWELQQILFLVGLTWGLGAFLLLPPGSVLAFAFAAIPYLTAALLLPCVISAAAFGAPLVLLTAGAEALSGQPQAALTGALILVAGVCIAGLSMLQCANPRRRAQGLR